MAVAGRAARHVCLTSIAGRASANLLSRLFPANLQRKEVSSQAGDMADLEGTFTERLGCPVGSTLTLRSSAGENRVVAESPHDAPESILLQVTWRGCPKPNILTKTTPGAIHVEVGTRELGGTLPDGQGRSGTVAGVKVDVAMPDRFCGLDITTFGGDVEVERIQEATLNCSTQGGSLTLGNIKAHDAAISTQGGPVRGGALVAKGVNVYSGGGDITLKKLMGICVSLDARARAAGGNEHGSGRGETGNVSISTTYADRLAVQAGEATLGTLKCEDGAVLQCQGNVQIDGLDGNAVVLSHGGHVNVTINERASLVGVKSDGGDITCNASPGFLNRLSAKPRPAQLSSSVITSYPQTKTEAHVVRPLPVNPKPDVRCTTLSPPSPNPATPQDAPSSAGMGETADSAVQVGNGNAEVMGNGDGEVMGNGEVMEEGPWGLLSETQSARYPGPFGRILARLGRVFAQGRVSAEGLETVLVLDARRTWPAMVQGKESAGERATEGVKDGSVIVKEQSWFEGVAARKAAREAQVP